MMAGGADVAQCNVSSLPTVAVERLPTLEQFQDDVRHALGKKLRPVRRGAQFASETD